MFLDHILMPLVIEPSACLYQICALQKKLNRDRWTTALNRENLQTVETPLMQMKRMNALDAYVLYKQTRLKISPSWTSRVRSRSPALLCSVTYFFLSALFTCQTVLNDIAVMLSASKYFPSLRLCRPGIPAGYAGNRFSII